MQLSKFHNPVDMNSTYLTEEHMYSPDAKLEKKLLKAKEVVKKREEKKEVAEGKDHTPTLPPLWGINIFVVVA